MIKFPRRHIADDVAERIMAVEKKLGNKVQAQSDQLDEALAQPVGDVAPIEGIEDLIPIKALKI